MERVVYEKRGWDLISHIYILGSIPFFLYSTRIYMGPWVYILSVYNRTAVGVPCKDDWSFTLGNRVGRGFELVGFVMGCCMVHTCRDRGISTACETTWCLACPYCPVISDPGVAPRTPLRCLFEWIDASCFLFTCLLCC